MGNNSASEMVNDSLDSIVLRTTESQAEPMPSSRSLVEVELPGWAPACGDGQVDAVHLPNINYLPMLVKSHERGNARPGGIEIIGCAAARRLEAARKAA